MRQRSTPWSPPDRTAERRVRRTSIRAPRSWTDLQRAERRVGRLAASLRARPARDACPSPCRRGSPCRGSARSHSTAPARIRADPAELDPRSGPASAGPTQPAPHLHLAPDARVRHPNVRRWRSGEPCRGPWARADARARTARRTLDRRPRHLGGSRRRPRGGRRAPLSASARARRAHGGRSGPPAPRSALPRHADARQARSVADRLPRRSQRATPHCAQTPFSTPAWRT